MSLNIIDIREQNRSQWKGANNTHEFIVLHYLGVPNADNANLYNNGYGGHFYVARSGNVYQAADENQVIWHVGASSGFQERYPNGWKPTNYNCIGIEMGVYKDNTSSTAATDNDWYYSKETQESAVELVKYLMKKWNIPADHVLRHGDCTTKRCPAPWFNTTTTNRYKTNWTWDEFKAKISGTNTTTTGGTSYMFTVNQIKEGATGKEVKLLQKLLKAEGKYTGEIDGSFGPATKKAVKAYQETKKLTVDGICGPNTWKSLLGL